VSLLPPEITEQILCYLTVPTLLLACRVSKFWNKTIRSATFYLVAGKCFYIIICKTKTALFFYADAISFGKKLIIF
jgi:hypothetical protein